MPEGSNLSEVPASEAASEMTPGENGDSSPKSDIPAAKKRVTIAETDENAASDKNNNSNNANGSVISKGDDVEDVVTVSSASKVKIDLKSNQKKKDGGEEKKIAIAPLFKV